MAKTVESNIHLDSEMLEKMKKNVERFDWKRLAKRSSRKFLKMNRPNNLIPSLGRWKIMVLSNMRFPIFAGMEIMLYIIRPTGKTSIILA